MARTAVCASSTPVHITVSACHRRRPQTAALGRCCSSAIRATQCASLGRNQQQPISTTTTHQRTPHAARRVRCRAAPVVFEPRVDPTVLYAQLFVLAAAAGAGAYWWWSLVPTLRRNLAKEKRSGGQVYEYLEEIQADDRRGLERWFYTDWLQQLRQRQQMAAQAAAKRAAAAAAAPVAVTGVAPHQGPATTTPQLQQQDRRPATSSDPLAASSAASADGLGSTAASPPPPAAAAASPSPAEAEEDDKEPSFWSLDNPILATAAALSALTLVSISLHR